MQISASRVEHLDTRVHSYMKAWGHFRIFKLREEKIRRKIWAICVSSLFIWSYLFTYTWTENITFSKPEFPMYIDACFDK